MVKFKGINHLAMVTNDIEKTIRFWRDLLGMRLIVTMGKRSYKHYFFEISDTDCIAFFEWEGVENIPEKDHGRPVKEPFAFDHVSFGVEKKDDLWELQGKLRAAGFWASEVVDHGFILSLYSFDPNNIPIEFSWETEGVDIRRSPFFFDSDPGEAAEQGSEMVPGIWPEPEVMPEPGEKHVYPGAGSEYFYRNKGKKSMP